MVRLSGRLSLTSDTVDRLYDRYISKASVQDTPDAALTPSSADIVSAVVAEDEPYSFQRHIQIQPDYEKLPLALVAAPVTRPSPLTDLLAQLALPASDTLFSPADEELPLPMAKTTHRTPQSHPIPSRCRQHRTIRFDMLAGEIHHCSVLKRGSGSQRVYTKLQQWYLETGRYGNRRESIAENGGPW